jgi:DnaD/phage-associated family protein
MNKKLTPFKGFPAGKVQMTRIPGPFFSDLLPQIDHLGELKLTLYVFWRLDRMVSGFNYLRRVDFQDDPIFMGALSNEDDSAQLELDESLKQAVQRGTLLAVDAPVGETHENLYFLNSPKGRAAVQAIQRGEWQPSEGSPTPAALRPEPANIFRLYEQHIGPITPLIAESLGEAEDTYPASWIEEAYRIAVERNARNWRYIETILKRWQEEGRHAQEDRRDIEKTGRKYIEGELSDYIKH